MPNVIVEDWKRLDLWVRRLLLVGLPALILLMFDTSGHLSTAFLSVVGVFYFWRLAKWAVRTDREERSKLKFEKSFLEELREIDAKVRESMPFTKPPRPDKGVQFRNSEGIPMLCIICGAYTNRGGRFCDQHDE